MVYVLRRLAVRYDKDVGYAFVGMLEKKNNL